MSRVGENHFDMVIRSLFILCLALLAMPSQAAVLGEIWSGRPDVPAVAATLGDLDGDGVPELVVAGPDRLEIYVWEPEAQRFEKQMSVGGFPAPVSTVTTGKASGRPGHDLWVGMQGSGSIQRFSLDEHGLVGHGTVARLWTSVSQLHAVDIDADGDTDLLALGQDGVAVLFRGGADGFVQVWRTEAGEDADRRVTVGYYAPGPLPTLVFGKDQGLVALYRWQASADGSGGTLVKLAENYPWGVISAVDLVPRDGHEGADLYIATTQSLLYKYTWDGATSRHVTQWSQDAANAAVQLQALRIPGLSSQLWVGSQSGTLTAWRLTADGLEEAWRLVGEEMAWISQSETGHLITYSRDGKLRVLGAVPDSYLRVHRDGVGYALQNPPLFEGNQLFLAADDLVRVLRLRAWTSRNGTRLAGVASWFQFFLVDAGAEAAAVNGRSRPLSAPARMVGDVPLSPFDFASLLGFRHELTEPIRSLTFY